MPRRLPRYLVLALALYWAAMFVATHIPGDALPKQALASDKVLHFIAYAALAWLAALALWAKGWWNWKLGAGLFLAGAIYAIVDEWLQPYFDRDASFTDWLADLAGIVCGIIAFQLMALLARCRNRTQREATAPRPPAAS